MIYELRIYHILPGRWEAINDRFKNHTLSIFNRLGMKVVDFWESMEDKPKLYYVMEYESMEARDRQWETFRDDPEWIEARTKSEEDGKIVEKVDVIFMKRAEYFRK
ncbi:NIPSNAP family protein [Paenibacillus humicola]|uniref:NIPSNAP family protein n=1 Tax=Paenibacillus humicola TaxID=3110540 RepID=UPI00237AC099|nr:NIPSNAP family protein [Paenibacillus humicola]